MALKISYFNVIRFNKATFDNNSTLFIGHENNARVFNYQDYEKLLSLTLKVPQMDFDKKFRLVQLRPGRSENEHVDFLNK